MKENTKTKELREEEVNVYASCNTHIKTACLVDCINGTAWLTTKN
jgi:hypothetical protein